MYVGVYRCVCTYTCTLRVGCEDDRARVASRSRYRPVECLGEDWTRKRHDGSRTMGARVFLPLSFPLSTLSPSLDLSPPSACSSLRYWCASSLLLSPFLPWSLRETSEHRRADSLHQPTINTPAGLYFRPRNRNFRSSFALPVSVLRYPRSAFARSHPRLSLVIEPRGYSASHFRPSVCLPAARRAALGNSWDFFYFFFSLQHDSGEKAREFPRPHGYRRIALWL